MDMGYAPGTWDMPMDLGYAHGICLMGVGCALWRWDMLYEHGRCFLRDGRRICAVWIYDMQICDMWIWEMCSFGMRLYGYDFFSCGPYHAGITMNIERTCNSKQQNKY